MGAFGNTGPGLGARGWGTASDMARHRVLASLCMGKGKKKIKDIGGKTHSCGKEKERNREGADGETEKPEKRSHRTASCCRGYKQQTENWLMEFIILKVQ